MAEKGGRKELGLAWRVGEKGSRPRLVAGLGKRRSGPGRKKELGWRERKGKWVEGKEIELKRKFEKRKDF